MAKSSAGGGHSSTNAGVDPREQNVREVLTAGDVNQDGALSNHRLEGSKVE
jgi:hypothetical protein